MRAVPARRCWRACSRRSPSFNCPALLPADARFAPIAQRGALQEPQAAAPKAGRYAVEAVTAVGPASHPGLPPRPALPALQRRACAPGRNRAPRHVGFPLKKAVASASRPMPGLSASTTVLSSPSSMRRHLTYPAMPPPRVCGRQSLREAIFGVALPAFFLPAPGLTAPPMAWNTLEAFPPFFSPCHAFSQL